MSKSLKLNYSDTNITGATAISLPVPNLNYAEDFRVSKDEPNEAVITNLTSPISQPERFRFAHSDVANVYGNTGIDPTMYYASRRGTQILCQLTDVFKVTDSADAAYEALLPISCHLVVKVPNNELVTEQVVIAEIQRLMGGLFQTEGSENTLRLNALLRGALVPTSL